jgi:hypothetical protein
MSSSIESDVTAFLAPGSEFSQRLIGTEQVNRKNITAVTAELFAVAVSNTKNTQGTGDANGVRDEVDTFGVLGVSDAKDEVLLYSNEGSVSISDHYADAAALFYRSALESPGAESAIEFYSVMDVNGCCPKCANIYLLLSGMAVIEDIGEEVADAQGTFDSVRDSVSVSVGTMDDGLCKRAVVFAARKVAHKLVALKLKAIELKCFDFCQNPFKSIKQMRESIHGSPKQ